MCMRYVQEGTQCHITVKDRISGMSAKSGSIVHYILGIERTLPEAHLVMGVDSLDWIHQCGPAEEDTSKCHQGESGDNVIVKKDPEQKDRPFGYILIHCKHVYHYRVCHSRCYFSCPLSLYWILHDYTFLVCLVCTHVFSLFLYFEVVFVCSNIGKFILTNEQHTTLCITHCDCIACSETLIESICIWCGHPGCCLFDYLI